MSRTTRKESEREEENQGKKKPGSSMEKRVRNRGRPEKKVEQKTKQKRHRVLWGRSSRVFKIRKVLELVLQCARTYLKGQHHGEEGGVPGSTMQVV